ncbi:probable E3 ubiquitin-protein ligase RHY1A [Telopea speciosissima]|uniref:probable E3 ubiquitin-protein ligase RHY1A n=1 Tax=Telopea speciosissima TaxID=54955 RepID=UPI001CC54A5A|nr:probable E3 ubiquitin-protein ligase RHY1A [Telopea speciosissima]XP_043707954.1 probable E3 ubiquitin-protein ligase RHY1A [Telopea speciosissima]
MPGASELFYGRRSRIGRITPEPGGIGISEAPDRNPYHHHHHNNNNHNHRHHHNRNRSSHDVRPLCYRTFQSERESIRIENVASQSGTSNDTSTEISSSRASRLRFTRNDRLPGAVLLARERLVERLRGVSLSGNRQSGRASSGISWDEFAVSDDFRLVDAGDWETEGPREWFPLSVSDSQTGLSSLPGLNHKKPPGLSREEVKCLRHEVFNKMGVSDERLVLIAAQECSICLERFQEGDLLVSLPCEHRFHSACLEPWVLTRGDCPYCRTGVVVGDHPVGTNILP